VRRSGPLRDRLALKASRSLGVAAWRLCERLGSDIGATEGPPVGVDPDRREALERLLATADGTIAAADCPYPLHELLTHLVAERGLLLHGSNRSELDVLEPRRARDWTTELEAVVASDDAIWPIFYAVVDRERVDGVFSACTHIGRRRFYMFAVHGATAWTDGAVYALRRDGFRREWGNEWVSGEPVRPTLRVLVGPADFPLRDATIGVAAPEEFRRVRQHLRAAKRSAPNLLGDAQEVAAENGALPSVRSPTGSER
jgi:hypothetical protein